MEVRVVDDAQELAHTVASFVAERLAQAIADCGRAVVAFSGGSTPAPMLRALAGEAIDWPAVIVFQVDERVAPGGAPERNATMLQRELLDHVPARAYLMPVERDRLEDAAGSYALLIGDVCGGVLDVVHLGLGADGHTASLVPGDPVVETMDTDVAVSGEYQGNRRMTMTLPLLNRARAIAWEVVGAGKAEAVARLVRRDREIPAARVSQDHAALFVDTAAAGALA